MVRGRSVLQTSCRKPVGRQDATVSRSIDWFASDLIPADGGKLSENINISTSLHNVARRGAHAEGLAR
jgi:hypothetical protein